MTGFGRSLRRAQVGLVALSAAATLAACSSSGPARTSAATTAPNAPTSSSSPTSSAEPAADEVPVTCEAVSTAVGQLGVVPEDAALDQAAASVTSAADTAAPALRGQVLAVASALTAQRDAADGTEQIDARRAVLEGLDALDELCLAGGSTALH